MTTTRPGADPRSGRLASAARALAALCLACAAALSAPPAAADDLAAALAERGYVRVSGEDARVEVFRDKSAPDVALVARGALPFPPDAVLDALLAYEKHPKYLDRLGEARVLERGERRLLVYERLELPFISDRDHTLAVRWGRDGETRFVEYAVARDAGPPPKEGVVRIERHAGRWQVEPGPEPGTSVLRYHLRLDLGGSLPMVLVQMGATKDVEKVYAAICRMAADGDEEKCK